MTWSGPSTLSSVFPSVRFMFMPCSFRSWFYIDLRWGSSFIPLHLSFQVSQHHSCKRLSFRSCLGILSFGLVWKGGDQLSSRRFYNLVPTSPPHPPLPTPHCISYNGMQNVHLGCSFEIPCAFQIFFSFKNASEVLIRVTLNLWIARLRSLTDYKHSFHSF